jgi:DNA-binding MarR family transcriptional regulator
VRKKEKSLVYYFLREKPVGMLLQLRKDDRRRYASVLAKEVDCTYSHTVRILQTLEKSGIVQFEKRGRQKIISLTKNGREIADTFKKLVRLFRRASKS